MEEVKEIKVVSSYREYVKRERKFIFIEFSILTFLFIIIPSISGFYLLWLVTLGIIYSIYTLAWNCMETMLGRTSLGHAIPFGLAGYLSAIVFLYTQNSIFLPVAWIFAGIASALLLFMLSLSKDRIAFVFITFLIGAAIWILSPLLTLTKEGSIYGGEEGFSLPPVQVSTVYGIAALMLLASFLFFGIFRTSLTGLKFKTVRDDEKAAKIVGVKVSRVKAFCSLISAVIAALAGGLYSLHFSHVSPEVFSVHIALFPFIATVFFRNSEIGGIAGSFILVFASNYLNSIFPQLYLLLYAALLILSPLMRRGGLIRLLIRQRSLKREERVKTKEG
ncbi:MAG: branched-chain amino acid ABC transporter permease [Archaeoglobus sp.]|nr:branched-chain amino acid ABC transporter permease [Archaeoglobus sp.]